MSLSDKDKILDHIFISSEETNKLRIAKNNKEQLELRKTIASQRDLITSIPEILAKIIRKKDINENNILLQSIFQEFCNAMDKHGVTYNLKKLESKVRKRKLSLMRLEEQLKESREKDKLVGDDLVEAGE